MAKNEKGLERGDLNVVTAGSGPGKSKVLAAREGGSGIGVIPKLNVRITKTSDGQRHYVQLTSEDMVSVNIVLIADVIQVHDNR